jgi:hypothetical protein
MVPISEDFRPANSGNLQRNNKPQRDKADVALLLRSVASCGRRAVLHCPRVPTPISRIWRQSDQVFSQSELIPTTYSMNVTGICSVSGSRSSRFRAIHFHSASYMGIMSSMQCKTNQHTNFHNCNCASAIVPCMPPQHLVNARCEL